LRRVTQAGGRATLNFANGRTVDADHAIIAVPAALYRSIAFDGAVPSLWRAFLGEIGPGRVEKLVIGCHRRPWLKAFGSSGELWAGPGFAEAWDATGGQPHLASGALAFLPGGAQIDAFERTRAQALATAWTRAAESAVPGLTAARNGRVRRTAWARDPFTLGAYVNYRPGQLTRFSPLLWTDSAPLEGRFGALSFVGEHMSAAFPGYMNGGAETGRRAAEAIIAQARGAIAA
jgi:monoamine oxidase